MEVWTILAVLHKEQANKRTNLLYLFKNTMFRKTQYNLAKFFNFPIEAERNYRVQTMHNEIRRMGGSLRFKIQKNSEGWTAECENFKGIITGGTDPKATDEDINSQIKDAIFTAFGIPPYLSKDSLVKNTGEQVIVEEERVFA